MKKHTFGALLQPTNIFIFTVPENPQDEIKNKYLGLLKVLFADALSSELMKRGRAEITEEKLYKLVTKF